MASTSATPTTKARPTSAPTETTTRPRRPAKAKELTVGVALKPGVLVPVMMDVDTAKFLLRSLTSALNQVVAGKKKKK